MILEGQNVILSARPKEGAKNLLNLARFLSEESSVVPCGLSFRMTVIFKQDSIIHAFTHSRILALLQMFRLIRKYNHNGRRFLPDSLGISNGVWQGMRTAPPQRQNKP